MESRSRYAVVPDIFAGRPDHQSGGSGYAQPRLRLPSPICCCNADCRGQRHDRLRVAIQSHQAVGLTLDGGGDGRADHGDGDRLPRRIHVLVAILAAPGIWHQKKIARLDAVRT